MLRASLLRASLAALFFFAAGGARADTEPAHDMVLRLDPAAHRLAGEDTIRFDVTRAATLVLSPRFTVDSLEADGRSVKIQPRPRSTGALQKIPLPPARRIAIRWSGTLVPLDAALEHRETLDYAEPASGAEGTFLPAASAWYPSLDGELERYRARIELPAGQRGLVPGRLVDESDDARGYRATFDFPHPSEGISLMAGPYRVEERRVRTAAGTDVRLRTHFHAEIASLASGYLDAVSGYLDLYERWIGAYPFSEFSVVSSPTPTGFGMPTLTYLGTQVLRLPFIRATSLGHEILHNWWGNGVYPDVSRGNWSESLTTFMADSAYRERDGPEPARAMRLTWLREYAAMPRDQDLPLARFTSRRHGASQIVGYHKGAMVFFMLRELIGAPAFDEGVRRFWRERQFRVASWDDLKSAFEAASGRKLQSFFSQWLSRAGAPDIRIAEARVQRNEGAWRVEAVLEQQQPAFTLTLPLEARTAAGVVERRVEVSGPRERVVFDLAAEPRALVLDPNQRVFRRLSKDEAPPILREAMLSERAELFLPGTDEDVRAAGRKLAARFFEQPPREPSPGARPSAFAGMAVGRAADIDQWLAGNALPPRPASLGAARGSAQVWTLRIPGGATMAIVSVRDAAALAAIASPLPHYGQQSYLVFEGARAIENGVWPAQPQTWNFTTR